MQDTCWLFNPQVPSRKRCSPSHGSMEGLNQLRLVATSQCPPWPLGRLEGACLAQASNPTNRPTALLDGPCTSTLHSWEAAVPTATACIQTSTSSITKHKDSNSLRRRIATFGCHRHPKLPNKYVARKPAKNKWVPGAWLFPALCPSSPPRSRLPRIRSPSKPTPTDQPPQSFRLLNHRTLPISHNAITTQQSTCLPIRTRRRSP